MDEKELRFIKSKLKEFDPDYLVDVLGISSTEILNKFERKIIDNLDEFEHFIYGAEHETDD